MADDYIIHQYAETLYSCLLPHDMHFEHRMPSHAIIFVRSGVLRIEQGGRITDVEAGNYVFVKRDCTVRITKMPQENEPYTGINLTLHRDELKKFYSSLPPSRLPKNLASLSQTATILPKSVPLDSLFVSLAYYVDHDVNPSADVLALKVQEAIMALLDVDPSFYPTLFDFNEAWKIDILDFMERNFTEDLTIEEFASYTGRSLATFKRDFSKVSDLSPERWLIEHRLDRAYELISASGARPSDVYIQVGFKNRSHFSVAFKRKFGVSPSACATT